SVLQDRLVALETIYTAEHPDVIKMRKQVEDLKKRIADSSKAGPPTQNAGNITEPLQIQQLRAKLRQDDQIISDLTKRQGQIQDQIRTLQGRIQSTPDVEQRFKELTRSYQSAQEFYNDLLKRKQQSEVVTDLTHQQGGEQFRVLDPPSLPTKPSFPKKLYFGGGGSGAGFALGLAILYLIAASDKAMYTERDVEISLKLPVLAMIPSTELTVRSSSSSLAGALPGPKTAEGRA